MSTTEATQGRELLSRLVAELREWAEGEREGDPSAADYGQAMADLFDARLAEQDLGEVVDRLAVLVDRQLAEEQATAGASSDTGETTATAVTIGEEASTHA